VLASPEIAARLPDELILHLESLCLDGVERLIDAPASELVRLTSITVGNAFSLSGRQVNLGREETKALSGKEFVAAG
jgi:hypothetical protein